ncbi:LPXTG cell wall anchor domain-containing protein, partial [bacterium c-19]|nr:LPXTG cell wall anchor domain-containing protein [bacterium c-19]
DGDGLPDINVDVDGDGTPDKNIKEITEWKPDKNVDGEFPFDTMTFDESEEPNKANEPKDPDQQGHDTDVKGTYYPGDSVGGANTGDSTDSILFIVMLLLSLFTLLLLSFKNKYHNEGRT